MSTPVIRNLPHQHEWHPAVKITRRKAVNATPMDPLHDECSGIANLDAWEDHRRANQLALLLGLALLGLAGLLWLAVLIFNNQ